MSTEKKKLALFVGSDVTAQIVLNRLIDDISDQYEPMIFLPEYPASSRSNLPELKRFAFYDRHLLQDTVYPFIEHKRIYAGNRSPNLIAKDHGYTVEKVANVNAPEFVERLQNEPNLFGAVSIRCFQIFKDPIINLMNGKGLFLNLHPGILPQYRGVMSVFRTMAAGEDKHGWTLHKVDRGIDTGEILWVKAKPMDSSKSGYTLNLDIASIGARCIVHALQEIEDGNVLKGFIQPEDKAGYFTYPTPEELADWKTKGIKLVDPEEVVHTLVDKFSQAGTSHARDLKYELKKAIDHWEHTNNLSAAPITTGVLNGNGHGNGNGYVASNGNSPDSSIATTSFDRAVSYVPSVSQASVPAFVVPVERQLKHG